MCCALPIALQTAHATDWQTLEQMHAHPELQNLPAGSQLSIRVQEHPKLNDSQCPLPLFKLAPAQKLWGKAVAQVQCPGHGNALFFVTLKVEVMAPVLVTTRALPKGASLEATDTRQQMHDITQSKSELVHNPKQLEQKKTTQALAAGTVIETRYVEGPTLVKQGDNVRVKLAGPGFGVEGQAVALDNGGLGEAVRVRTPQGRVLRAKAIEFMVVELLL